VCMCACACVCARARACVCARARVCVRVCVRARARVCARARASVSVYVCVSFVFCVCACVCVRARVCGGPTEVYLKSIRAQALGLYKIVFYFEAFVHESIIRLLPLPTCIARTVAMILHD